MVVEEKPAPDWERIEFDYRAGLLSSREIASAGGVSHTAINKRAKRLGWARSTKLIKTAPALLEEPVAKAGFVYVIFLDAPGDRFFKIGMSSFFSARFGEHKCSSPFEIRVACAYFTDDMRSEERALHDKYRSQNVRGEWFRLSDADLAEIATRSLLL